MVAQEPVYDLYRYLYMNRVRFENSLATPALYDMIAGTPGTSGDSISYQPNAVNDTCVPPAPLSTGRTSRTRTTLALLAGSAT